MKKFTKLAAVLAAMTVPLYAGTLDLKLGAASQKTAGDRAGLNAALGYNIGIDKYFTLTPEVGFNWHKFDRGTGQQVTLSTGQVGELTQSNNSFLVPVMLNAKVMIPTGGNSEWGNSGSLFTPYFGVGAGYAWMFNTIDTPATQSAAASSASNTLNGLMYQAFVGTSFKIADDSAVNFLIEAGYRGGEVELNNTRLNVAGWFAMAGVQFNLDMGQAASSW